MFASERTNSIVTRTTRDEPLQISDKSMRKYQRDILYIRISYICISKYYNKHVEITRTITFYLATIHRTTTTMNSYANISTIFVLHSTYSTYCTKKQRQKFQIISNFAHSS